MPDGAVFSVFDQTFLTESVKIHKNISKDRTPTLYNSIEEVPDITVTLFDEEYIAKMHERDLLNQGKQKGFEKSLRRLITAMNWPLEQAMTFLEIPEMDRPIYRGIFGK